MALWPLGKCDCLYVSLLPLHTWQPKCLLMLSLVCTVTKDTCTIFPHFIHSQGLSEEGKYVDGFRLSG